MPPAARLGREPYWAPPPTYGRLTEATGAEPITISAAIKCLFGLGLIAVQKAAVRGPMSIGLPRQVAARLALRRRGPFAYVNVFKAHVNVGFSHGIALPDPARLLEGTGKRMRHVKLRPGVNVDSAALSALISGACGYQGG